MARELIFALGTSQAGWVDGPAREVLVSTHDDLSPIPETLHEKAHVWCCAWKPTAKETDTGRLLSSLAS